MGSFLILVPSNSTCTHSLGCAASKSSKSVNNNLWISSKLYYLCGIHSYSLIWVHGNVFGNGQVRKREARHELDTLAATVGDSSHGPSPVTRHRSQFSGHIVTILMFLLTHTNTGDVINILHQSGSILPIYGVNLHSIKCVCWNSKITQTVKPGITKFTGIVE